MMGTVDAEFMDEKCLLVKFAVDVGECAVFAGEK